MFLCEWIVIKFNESLHFARSGSKRSKKLLQEIVDSIWAKPSAATAHKRRLVIVLIKRKSWNFVDNLSLNVSTFTTSLYLFIC